MPFFSRSAAGHNDVLRGITGSALGIGPTLGFQHTCFEDAFKGAPRASLFVSDQFLLEAILNHLNTCVARPS